MLHYTGANRRYVTQRIKFFIRLSTIYAIIPKTYLAGTVMANAGVSRT